MAEYISRNDAIDALSEYNEKSPTGRKAQDVVRAIPAADVVPVVRCGECKHSAVDFEDRRYCKFVTYYNHVPDDWFCADGEQKDGDGDG